MKSDYETSEFDAPTQVINELTLLSSEARLKGRQRNTPDEMLWGMTRAIIVPYHVYEALQPYAEAYNEVYGKELLP